MTASPQSRLSALRRRIQALETGASGRHPALPFGVAAMDVALPGRGLRKGALHEVTGAGADEEDGAVAAAFAAGILVRLEGPVLWCGQREDLYGPALAGLGLTPGRLVVARTRNDGETLWAMEEALRCPDLAAVLGEVEGLPATAGRRLQLAAEGSGVMALALRRWRTGAAAQRWRAAPSVALTRWRVTALPGALEPGEPGVGRPLWRVELLRCRGGVPAEWIVEGCDATGHVALPAVPADRPTEAAAPASRAG
jgi:protein ImuA